jgi:hypothetical protein
MQGFRQFFAQVGAIRLSPWSACTWGHDPEISVLLQMKSNGMEEFQSGFPHGYEDGTKT